MAKRPRWSRPGYNVQHLRDHPGDSGAIHRLVFGNDDAEFDRILEAEAAAQQASNPGIFTIKGP